jgi:hypothetical protein
MHSRLCGMILSSLAALALQSQAEAQELMVNGQFDQDLAGWELLSVPAPTWVPQDVQGNPLSGSASFSHPSAGITPNLRQCITLPARGYYRLNFSAIALPPEQSAQNLKNARGIGSVSVAYQVLQGGTCSSGGFVDGGNELILAGQGWRSFEVVLSANDELPMILGVSVSTFNNNTSNQVGWVDALSLTLDDRIHFDGFEN